MEKLSSLLAKLKLYVQVMHLGDITRRYFVKNGMDGSLTTLGIILGAWAVRVNNPNIIIGAGLGACLAMGVSGLFGAYITEKAERERQLKDFEESMLNELEGSLHQNASEFAPALVAFVDGSSPALTAIISLMPFFFTMTGLVSIWDSYVISLVLTLLTLFALGLYLGRVAEKRMWAYGFQMLAAGIVIAILMFLIGGTVSI
jgi:predicted membrane protein (TIGR00267 family)